MDWIGEKRGCSLVNTMYGFNFKSTSSYFFHRFDLTTMGEFPEEITFFIGMREVDFQSVNFQSFLHAHLVGGCQLLSDSFDSNQEEAKCSIKQILGLGFWDFGIFFSKIFPKISRKGNM